MTDFRHLCTELLLFAEQAGEICHNEGLWPNCDQQQVCVNGKPLWLLDRVRAALAEPQPEWPSLEEVEDLCEEHCFNVEGYESIECLQGLINDALARYGRQPTPPAAGEVAELVVWLLDGGEDAAANGWDHQARQFGRAAELLQRLQPEPPTDEGLEPSATQIEQLKSGLDHCFSKASAKEYLRVWVRDYARAVLARWGR